MLLICWLLIVYIFQGFKQVFVMLQLKNRPRHCGRNVENAGEQNFTRIGAREGYWITLAGKWVELDRIWAGSGPENGWTRLRLDSRWLGWFGTGLVMAKPLDSIKIAGQHGSDGWCGHCCGHDAICMHGCNADGDRAPATVTARAKKLMQLPSS